MTTETIRGIIGTAYRLDFVNDRQRWAIKLDVSGREVISRAANKATLRKRLKGFGFDAAAIAAAVPQD